MILHIPEPHAPLQRLQWKPAIDAGIELWIKREDLSHPFISGNKWRKLKYFLKHAKQEEKQTLVTFGGPFSNHLLAAAAAGAIYNFATHGFVRGEEVHNPTLALCKTFGMQLQFCSRETYRHKEELYQQYFGSNTNSLMIPEGGSGPLGEQGMAELWNDAGQWPCGIPQHVFTSVGTGSTMRGLLKGLAQNNFNTEVHGVVVLKGAESIDREFMEFDSARYKTHHQFHDGGYGKASPELWTFIKNFASNTGVLLDQVYEAKMMWGIETLLKQNYFKPGSVVVALHNGGLQGMIGSLVSKV